MAFHPNSPYGQAVIEQVLIRETNDTRFERFCNAAVSAIEGGAVVLSTSASWDMGRDGVGIAKASGIYVCSSLRDDIDGKVLADLQRITSTTKNIEKLYFCLSNKISEHRRNLLEGQLKGELGGNFSITCLGGNHLAEIVGQYTEIPERFYAADIDDVLRVLQAPPSDSAEIRGLRLALISASADDSDSIRKATYAAGLLDVLKGGVSLSVAMCAKGLSDSIKLHRTVAIETCAAHLTALEASGLVTFNAGIYSITDQGRKDVESREREGVGRLLALRQSIRSAIESSIDATIVDDEFNRMWKTFEDSMAQYFLARGEEIVSEIGSLLGDDDVVGSSSAEAGTSLSFLDELASSIAATSSHPERASELAIAVKDLFADRSGPASEWLVRISASFVAACAMGLESESGKAISRLLGKTSIVLDTDVVLSLVGEDEPEWVGVNSLVTRWKGLGGKVYVGEPVLEEFARHAHISQFEFEQAYHLLPGTGEDRLRLLKNVFVRSFSRMLAEKKAKISQWKSYISQFRGSSAYDWGNAAHTLRHDYSVEKLPPRSTLEAGLENEVREFLVASAMEGEGYTPYAKDKARRDAELYAAIVHHVKTIRHLDPAANCVLVSSARRLAMAEEQFHGAGDYQLVVSVSAMLYLVALIPGVSLGMTAMKSFLFEGYRPGLSGDLERTLLRMVRASRERELAFSKRGLLMTTVRQRMIKDAHEKGLRGSEAALFGRAAAEAFTPENQQRTLQILTEALDKIGAPHRVERENLELRKRNQELEAELARKAAKNR
jgi:hypothetical protein